MEKEDEVVENWLESMEKLDDKKDNFKMIDVDALGLLILHSALCDIEK